MQIPILSVACLLVAGASVAAQDVVAYEQDVERKCTRIAYFDDQGSPGQLSVQYGQPVWKDEYEEAMEALKGNRARLGQDFWTVLDANVDLEIGGVEVAAGAYYLALGRTAKGDWRLVLFDPAEIRAQHVDAYQSDQLGAMTALEVPLTLGKDGGKPADKLAIRLQKDDRKVGRARLSIRWGPHELEAPVVAKLGAKPKKGATKKKSAR